MSLISELKRRNVLRVAAAYVALAWLVVQVLDSLAPMFGISDETARLIVILMAIGLVPALVVSWLFELTPEGFKREGEVDHASADGRAAAKRLDRVIIGVLALAVVYFAVDKFVLDPVRDVEIAEAAAEQARDEALVSSFGDRSIAILPFADRSPGLDQQYFSDGIAEEIINLLSRVREIRVISRSSSFAFKGQDLSLAEIAARLDVRYVMEGSVRRAGERLRITAQLIDPGTDTQIWAESFDRDFGDIFAIQDEIAAAVVDRLEVELAGAVPKSAVVDPEAYVLYLRAKDLVNRQNWTATQEAEKLLGESLAIDEQNAAAWMLYWPIGQQKIAFAGSTWPEFAVQVREPLEKALAVDPDNARAKANLVRISYAAMSTWDGEAHALAYGMSLDPLDPVINRSVGAFLRTMSLGDRAIPYYEYALARDPMSAAAHRGLMLSHFLTGNTEAGLQANRDLRRLTGGAGGLWYRGMFLLQAGNTDQALADFTAWHDAQPDSPHAYYGLAMLALVHGDQTAFEENLAALEQNPGPPELLASLYAQVGRHEEAIQILDEAIQPPRDFGPGSMGANPLLRELHEHPRWKELLKRRGTHPDQIAEIGLDELFPGPGLPPAVPIDPP